MFEPIKSGFAIKAAERTDSDCAEETDGPFPPYNHSFDSSELQALLVVPLAVFDCEPGSIGAEAVRISALGIGSPSMPRIRRQLLLPYQSRSR